MTATATKPKKEKRRYRKRKTKIPQVHNKNELVDSLVDSLTRITGYTKKDIYENGTHDLSFWRRFAAYVLVTEFGWTQTSAGHAFGLSAPAISLATKKFDAIVESEERHHELVPHLERIIDDLVL